MIQRIQSVWLLLAGIINIGLFYFGIYKADVVNSSGAEVVKKITASNNIILLLIAVVTIALPLFAIFLFKNRKRQSNMTIMSILANISFMAAAIMIVGNFSNGTPTPTNGTYLVGIFLPIAAILFLFLAFKGIRKDIKTIKSLDRLR